MATNTTNYNLKKPDPSDFYNVQVFNDNADIIDTELKRIENKVDNTEVPVTSVNDKIGAVVLNASDVGAETPTGAQEKVDALAGAGNTKTVKQLDNELESHKAYDARHFTTEEKNKLAIAAKIAGGSYIGNNTQDRLISIGFTPILVIVTANTENYQYIVTGSTNTLHLDIESTKHGKSTSVAIVTNGFNVGIISLGNANKLDITYEWIAIGG